jgi:GntR family transcriptional regulator/MocR family aminotransferase
MHRLYAARREQLLSHLQGDLAAGFEPIVPTAGIHLAARLKAPLTEAAVIGAARGGSMALHGLASFHRCPPPQPGILCGYGGIEADRIDAALTTLAQLLPRNARNAAG